MAPQNQRPNFSRSMLASCLLLLANCGCVDISQLYQKSDDDGSLWPPDRLGDSVALQDPSEPQVSLASYVDDRVRGTESIALPTDSMVRLPPIEVEGASGGTFKDMLLDQSDGLASDYREFYSVEGMAWLGGGLVVGATMANTGYDEHFVRHGVIENIVMAGSDEIYEALHEPKFLGEGQYTIPVFVGTALLEPIAHQVPRGSRLAEWGQRSTRTLLVSGPAVLGLQWATGGGRPAESDESSEWRPFQDNNGVSGHAYMGAIPLMSAARMTDERLMKLGLYSLSTLPAISRVNDDSHFFSQAFLGWWLAYLGEKAVDRSFLKTDSKWQVSPDLLSHGVIISTRW